MPMFQRRQHKTIARVLAASDADMDLIHEFILMFERDNDSFNREQFMREVMKIRNGGE